MVGNMGSPRTILITGANTGIGLEIVKALCASTVQYTVIVAARSNDKASFAIKEVQEIHPTTQTKLVPLVLDVESDQSISAAAAYIQQNHGALDVLVNNAGASLDQAIA